MSCKKEEQPIRWFVYAGGQKIFHKTLGTEVNISEIEDKVITMHNEAAANKGCIKIGVDDAHNSVIVPTTILRNAVSYIGINLTDEEKEKK